MTQKEKLEIAALIAARDVGISTILFRNSLSKDLNLNLSESLCLTILGIKGSLSPSALSRLIGLTTGATTTMLDRLEKKGYIYRKANKRDRRGIMIELTDNFGEEAQEMVTDIQKAHKELIRSFSEDELNIIVRFLRKFTLNLINHSSDVRYIFEDLPE
jgi:DNA-binding MarR family transcriptional regulator